ncbi:type II toxin-antitoxin system RelE/ParE family toxin, partial [Vibrio parahaemolyticus]|nr:type II toxin-antitoxin system RelE/ParE family toxin [Vibrio parahaemolyticus]
KDLKKLQKQQAKLIINYLKGVAQLNDAKSRGKAMRYSKVGLWRYRVGDYRIICDIQENNMLVLVLAVGHRSSIYI